jgi:hypothetical protein
MTGFVLGAVVGVPVSYFFQPGLMRAVTGLGDYLTQFGNVWTSDSLGSTARISVIMCAIAGATAAALAKPRTPAKPPTQ